MMVDKLHNRLLWGVPLVWLIATLGCTDGATLEAAPSEPGAHAGDSASAGGAPPLTGGGGGASPRPGGAPNTSGGTSNAAAGAALGGGGTGAEGGSTSSAAGNAAMVDCTKVPSQPIEVTQLTGPRGYHGITFDGAGNLIAAHAGTLYKNGVGGNAVPLAAGLGDVEGIDHFPNGDLVAIVADDEGNASLTRITLAGAKTKLVDVDVGAYGVRVVPSGWVYFAQEDGLYAVHPESKEKRTIAVPEQPRVMDYSRERKLYVGTLTTELDPPRDGSGDETRAPETIGRLYVFDLDADYLPLGEARLFASQVGGGFHDGLGVDSCGNLFVADYQTSGLYRVTPDGKVALYQQWDMQTYGHSLAWGSGGWDELSLYLPQPYNDDTVVKVAIGVPARPRD